MHDIYMPKLKGGGWEYLHKQTEHLTNIYYVIIDALVTFKWLL